MKRARGLPFLPLLALAACSGSGTSKATTTGLRLDDQRWLGEPVVVENLTVWPVFTDRTVDVGDYLTLDDAQATGVAVVREVGGGGGAGQVRASDSSFENSLIPVQQVAAVQVEGAEQSLPRQTAQIELSNVSDDFAGGGAVVNTLQVENQGDVPLLICAGTIVKGGKQDRQIAQDVVVPPGATVPLDAFCVEQGRWTQLRDGVDTTGVFQTAGLVASKRVRASAQYVGDQQTVWSNVAMVNAFAGKSPATSTYLATVDEDDGEAVARRERIVAAVAEAFAALDGGGAALVGFGYAVNGEPLSVRTFASSALFDRHFPAFVRTMSLEADVAQRKDGAAEHDPYTGAADVDVLLAMVQRIGAAEASVRLERDGQKNVVRQNERGGNASCLIEADGGWVALTEDWTAPVEYDEEVAEELQALGALGYTGGR